MTKYDELAEQKIDKIITESVQSKTKTSYRPLQPQAKAVGRTKARNRHSFEELQGE